MLRVVRPGGVIIASRGSRTIHGDWWRAVREEFFRAAGNPAWPPGMDRLEELDEDMRSHGVGVKELPAISQSEPRTVNELLALLEDGVWSACWTIHPDMRLRAAAAARQWAVANLGDPDEPRSVTEVLTWRSYRLRA
jgi:hypothetical protein